MELDQAKDKYVLTNQEKRALIWRIERYKQKDFNYLPLNYTIPDEMGEIITFVEELANGVRELQQSMTMAAMHEVDTIQEKTTLKMQQQEKERHAKGGVAKGEKNRLFKEFILQEYNENNHYKTTKEFVNNIVDRLNQGEFDNLRPRFKTTTPETTIRNWITEFRKQKNTFRTK